MRSITTAALVALAAAGGPTLLELAGGGSFGFVCALVGAGAAILAPIALIAAVPSRWRHRALAMALGATIVAGACFAGLRVQNIARRAAFLRLANRSSALVTAISGFERGNGRAPATLDELVPKYIDHIPWTGLLAYRQYRYKKFADDDKRAQHWYDLGSRHGRHFVGLWKYPVGQPDHAILVLHTDAEERVVSADLDRMPSEVTSAPFDPAGWMASPIQRLSQAATLVRSKVLIGKHLGDIRSMLGAPNESTPLPTATWELRVDCGRGFLNWDVFFYWPSRAYPKYIYGGDVERVGDWAYVHE